jgi:hypothetical protein
MKGHKYQSFEKFFLLHFCNIKELTHERILNLQKNHNVYFSGYGRKRGYDDFCRTRKDPEERFFYLIEDEDIRSKASNAPKGFILPSDKKSNDLLHGLKSSQKDYRHFLDKCANGNLDLNFMNKLLDDFQSSTAIKFVKSKNEWKPEFMYNEPHLWFFEDHLNWEILCWFFMREGRIFNRVKKCKFCDSYFLFHRKDQKYCADKCSSNYRGRRWKTERRERYNKYMRENRPYPSYLWRGGKK